MLLQVGLEALIVKFGFAVTFCGLFKDTSSCTMGKSEFLFLLFRNKLGKGDGGNGIVGSCNRDISSSAISSAISSN